MMDIAKTGYTAIISTALLDFGRVTYITKHTGKSTEQVLKHVYFKRNVHDDQKSIFTGILLSTLPTQSICKV